MNSQRRPGSFRATSPDQPKAQTKSNANKKSKQQRDHHKTDRQEKSPERAEAKCASKRGSKKQQSKKEKDPHDCESEDKPHETPAPKRGTIHRQSKKQRDLRQSPENSESKYQENGASVPKNANNADENEKQASAQSKHQSKKFDCESEGKPRQTVKSKSDEKPAPKSQRKKESDPLNLDKAESLESSESKLEAKSTAKPRRRHESAIKTDSSDASDAQDASPAVSAHSTDRQKKSAEQTAMRGLRVDDTLGKVLKATIDKLKINKNEQSNASSHVNDITDKVIAHLKRNTTWCEEIERLRTGSYYENVKICEPDEFDVMMTIPVERVDIQEFDEAGAFYSIALKRHTKRHPLDRFLNEDKTIQASEMLSEFRDAVKKAVEKLPYQIEMQRKKPKCPAVTLKVKMEENGKTISVDFVLGLKVHRASWPDFTKDGFKIENWLGKKEKANMKHQPFYLVPKYEGKGNTEHDGVVAKDAWRISFSHVEKEILKKHGHSKTCCEDVGQKCCRKECLKLLKYLLQQLKEDDSKSNKLSSFCSYHAKTTLLHACATRGNDNEWAYSQLADCFQQLLEDFVKHLRNRHLPNFFIPSHNLLHQASPSSCDFLANAIEIQRNNNFPIFN
ncbi:cyclic GMP-AMP synthase-like [Sinocyclocheilus grahami]|uniref:Cyclic GMP-AMP synthase n=1 Tax=Sinocyclocheilus grahami TaxID=75366 RepID=A0A672RAN2_SINGR|nr:PREDICTED: cyclic GMP-AMP synthase-like [Sinocyclocheilus grahami]